MEKSKQSELDHYPSVMRITISGIELVGVCVFFGLRTKLFVD
jgi:hypothetical protein